MIRRWGIIAEYPNLTYLELDECRLPSSDGLAKLGKLTGLKEIHLWETKLNDDALAALATLTKLERLNLEGTNISNKSIDALSNFKQLKWLNIGGTRLNDEAATKLAELPQLAWVKVSNSGDWLLRSRSALGGARWYRSYRVDDLRRRRPI